MITLGYTDNTIPGPHATFRQQYRFPQTSTGAMRPTRKGSGSQFRYVGYEGGPKNGPTQLTWLSGLRGLDGRLLGLGAEGDETEVVDIDPITGEPIVRYKIPLWLKIAGPISIGVSVYHGYRRNQSVGWAIGWGLMGALFPIVTPAIALAQGFGKRKKK